MAVTLTRALQRDRPLAPGARTLASSELVLLALTSVVAVLAIGLSYAGRVHLTQHSAPSQSPVSLNAVTDAHALEAAFEPVFEASADRRFAAEHLLRYLRSIRDQGGRVANVGSILAVRIPVADIERSSVVEYRRRLEAVRKAAAPGPSGELSALPLFTAADLATVKPSLSVRSLGEFRRLALLWGVLYFLALWGVAATWLLRGFRGDGSLLAAAHLLTAIGFAVVLSRSDPLRDTTLFVRYGQGVITGCLACGLLSLIDFRKTALASLTYVPLGGALVLSMLLVLFGDGPGGSNAKVNLGSVQPVELIRLLLALFLAGYFARRWELLRQIRTRTIRSMSLPAWLHVPRANYVLPVAVGVGVALVFFFLQKDLGPALFVSCVFLATYAIARNRVGLAVAGIATLAGGFYVGYALDVSATLVARVHMWQSAWDNAVRGGDQVAQALWALSSGGVAGTGLGLGDVRYVPAGYTDLPLAAVGEEMGFVGLLCVAGTFAVIAVRGFTTALRAVNEYAFFLATIVTLYLVFPVLLMAAGMLGVVPLTGVVTPFLSYGGSAMVVNFAALGILASIRRTALSPTRMTPFHAGTRVLMTSLGLVALVLIGVLTNVQVIHADDYLVRPHLGLQADGIRRYQYNPRVLDVVASVPRGSVFDRNGLPLATSNTAIARRAAPDYKSHGVDLRGCPVPVEDRCYPLGGSAFHILGDVATRRNWSASNTSYVERDLQDRLRGFDDHAVTVTFADSSGRAVAAVRRDYRELVSLVRHRHEPDHADVKAFFARKRDITLTIDAPFQARVARILAKYAARSSTGHVAAVVMDPATGELLASVSYPFPGNDGEDEGRGRPSGGTDDDVLLDRARYGLYTPGSTFKLVTAAAALRLDPANWRASFSCTYQAGGRVGARIPGYGTVRDDTLDAHPHGTIDMRDGIVQSCNAYFAQLAVRIGPQPLLDTAALAGVSIARDNTPARARATLAQAGYGQGDVVVTPLRMARVATAIANGGLLLQPTLEQASVPSRSSGGVEADLQVGGSRTRSDALKGDVQVGQSGTRSDAVEADLQVGLASKDAVRRTQERFLTAAASRLLAGSLREAVLTGTGRNLASHRWRIAGKTGTAELSDAPSHAWFVGFAPYGDAEKRIAFAVLIENGGYGGASAAPAAGEIVTAAAMSGLVR